MSKNFELMQEALREMEQGPSPIPQSTTILFPSVVDPKPQPEQSDFDRVAQEECLKLVQRIFLTPQSAARRAVAFAGIDRGNGCSRICVETARTLAANTSGSVCVVDANFRNSSLPEFFRVRNHRGLAESLVEEDDIASFARQLTPSNLWLLPAGSLAQSSLSLLNSDRLKQRVEELRREFDFILIDTPAVNLYSDAVALGRVTDGVVVVLQADSTRRESALKGLNSLRDANIEVLGAVLNKRTFPIPDFLYRRL
jgi:capsular exopolysaccharide synthesis family protein